MAEWQPIDSAPKDGTPILGFAEGRMTTVRWSYGGWVLVECGAYAEDGEWWPTHWQPLPAPPEPFGAREEVDDGA